MLPYLKPEEYLRIERAAERKSEYVDGEMYAMAGASFAHNRLVANVIAELRQALRRTSCAVLPSDMRVRARPQGPYNYPDASVVCGEPAFADNEFDTLLNPVVIVEVLSQSTEAYDRGRKFEAYKSIESLREYLLLASDRIHADLYVRQPGEHWLLISAGEPDDVLKIDSVGAELRMADLYEKVNLG